MPWQAHLLLCVSNKHRAASRAHSDRSAYTRVYAPISVSMEPCSTLRYRQSTPAKRVGGMNSATSALSLKLHSDKFINARSTAIRCPCGDNADRGHMIQCEVSPAVVLDFCEEAHFAALLAPLGIRKQQD